MKKFYKITQISLHLMAGALFLLALIHLAPQVFGIRPFIVLSGSMEPELLTGSVVFIDTRAAPEQIHVGDIITYRIENSTVTHRVVAETPATVTTKGDANQQADFSPVPRENILGRAVFDIPYLGYVYTKLSHPIFLAVLGSLLAENLIIEAICNLKTRIQQKKKKEKQL